MAVRINKADFEEKVLKSDLPVIVDFYSDFCIACKKLAPALGDVEDDYERSGKRISDSSESNPSLCKKCRSIRSKNRSTHSGRA